jgi:hypothetical protein
MAPFEANELLPIVQRTKKITFCLLASRSHGGFAPLDQLTLHNVGREFSPIWLDGGRCGRSCVYASAFQEPS